LIQVNQSISWDLLTILNWQIQQTKLSENVMVFDRERGAIQRPLKTFLTLSVHTSAAVEAQLGHKLNVAKLATRQSARIAEG